METICFCNERTCGMHLVRFLKDDWDNRPIEDSLNARIKELEETIKKMEYDAWERGTYDE